MIWPVQIVRITNGFRASHQGADFAPPKLGQTGVQVYAPETSIVIASAYTMPVEGHYIILKGLETGKFYYFGHFEKRLVQTGRGLDEGTVIGIMGKTGKATNIHTHCEVRDERNSGFSGKHDPEKWFKEHVKEDDMTSSDAPADELTWRLACNNGLIRQPTDQELKYWLTLKYNGGQAQRYILESKEHQEIARLVEVGRKYEAGELPPEDFKPYDGKPLYTKK